MKRHLVAVFERAGWTFAQAFLAVLTVEHGTGLDLHALKLAGVAGAYSVAKYLLVLANAQAAAPSPPAG